MWTQVTTSDEAGKQVVGGSEGRSDVYMVWEMQAWSQSLWQLVV